MIDSSSRIIAAGAARPAQGSDICMVRLTKAGALDPAFNNGSGKIIFDNYGQWDTAGDISLQSGGKIILSGTSYNASGNQDLTVLRYNPDGSIDSVFGQNGLVLTDFLGGADSLAGGNIQIDPACKCEKIVLVGVARNGSSSFAAAVRYIP